MSDFWVFGYGSLIWNPGFDYLERQRAHLFGYRRSLCIRSWVHRGTQERPGLVLGLDRGGSCSGLAFKVSADLRADVIGYLRGRELVTNVYQERELSVRLETGMRTKAIGYVVDRGHTQYAGSIDVEEAVRGVSGAVGQSGRNEDYVISTVEHLRALGIRDHWLEDVASRIG